MRRSSVSSTAGAYILLAASSLAIGVWPYKLWALFVCGTVGMGATWSLSTLLPTLVSKVTAPAERGRVLGYVHLFWNLAMILSSLTGGYLFETWLGLPSSGRACGRGWDRPPGGVHSGNETVRRNPSDLKVEPHLQGGRTAQELQDVSSMSFFSYAPVDPSSPFFLEPFGWYHSAAVGFLAALAALIVLFRKRLRELQLERRVLGIATIIQTPGTLRDLPGKL